MITRASQERIQTYTMRILTSMTALILLLGSSHATAQEAPAPTPQNPAFQPFLGSPSPFPFQGFAGLPGSPSASPRPLNPFFSGTFNGQPAGNPFLPPLVAPNQQFAFQVPPGFPGSAIPGPQFQGFPGSPLTGRPPLQGIANGFPGQFSQPGSFQVQPNLSGQPNLVAGRFPDTSPISPLREVPATVNDGQISGRGLDFGNGDSLDFSNNSPTTQAPFAPATPLSSPPTTPVVPDTTTTTRSPPTSTASPSTTIPTLPTTTTTTTTSTTMQPSTTTTPPPTTTTTSSSSLPSTTTPPSTTTTNPPSTTTSTTTSSTTTAQPTLSTASTTTVSRPVVGQKSRTETGRGSLASRLQNFAQQASNKRGNGQEKVLLPRPNRVQGQNSAGRESEPQSLGNTISESSIQSQDDYDQSTSDTQSQPEASITTSTTTTSLPASVSTEKAKKRGRKRPLTRTQQFLERLQKLRERRLTSTTGRPRRPEQENNVQDNQLPPRSRTPQRQSGTDFNSRLRNRVFASRSPTGGVRNRISDDENSSVSFRATRRPIGILGFTTKRPLTIRERLELHRQNNRFVPKHLRTTTKQTTTSTPPPSTTTTTTTTTTEIPSTELYYDYINDYEPEAPTIEVTERAPTTTTTKNVPETRVVPTERTYSKVQSIRERIAAMLGANGLAGKTTTEEVLTILEEVTVKPLSMATTDTSTQSSVTVTDNPILMVHTDEEFGPTEMPLDEILSTIIETIATSELPPTTQALHSPQPSVVVTTPTPESLPFVSISTSEPEASTTSKPMATDEMEISSPKTPKIVTSTEQESTYNETNVEETNLSSGTIPDFTDSTADVFKAEHTEIPELITDTLNRPATEDPLVQDLIAQLVSEGIITEVNAKSEVRAPEMSEESTIVKEELSQTEERQSALNEEAGTEDLEINEEKNPVSEDQPVATSVDNQKHNNHDMDMEVSEKEKETITDNQNNTSESLTMSNASQKAMEEAHILVSIDQHANKTSQELDDQIKVMTNFSLGPEDQADHLQVGITEHFIQGPENETEVVDAPQEQEHQIEIIEEITLRDENTEEHTQNPEDQADVMISPTEGKAEGTEEISHEVKMNDAKDLNQAEVMKEPLQEPEVTTDNTTGGSKDQLVTEEFAQGFEEETVFTQDPVTDSEDQEITETPAEPTRGQLRTNEGQTSMIDSKTIAAENQTSENKHQTLTENTEGIEDIVVVTTESQTSIPEDLRETDENQTTLSEDLELTTENEMVTTTQTQLTGSQTRTTPFTATTEPPLLTDITDIPTTILTTEEIIASELETDPFVTLSEDGEVTVDSLSSTALPISTTSEIPTTSKLPSLIKIPVLSNRTTTTLKPTITPPRMPGFNPSSPRVSSVKMMDTTTRFQKNSTDSTTDLPPTTTPESQLEDYITSNDDPLETPPPVLVTETPVFQETTSPEGEITPTEENEVDTTLSMNHLHMLLHSFDITSIRPELAAMNHVLDFSLSTDQGEELGSNTDVTGSQNFDFDYDLEPASTEQVIVTTSLQTPTFAALATDNQGGQNTVDSTTPQGIMITETNTPTVLNMEVAVLTVSEPYSKVQNITESPKTAEKSVSISTVENSTMEDVKTIPESATEAVTDPMETTTETVSDFMETTTVTPVTTTEEEEIPEIKEPLNTNNKSDNTIHAPTSQVSTAVGKATIAVVTPSPTSTPEEKESDTETNVEVSAGNKALSREDRERQRLAWLRKNGSKDGQQPRTRQLQSSQRRTSVPTGNVRSTPERPKSPTGRRLSLSELLSQRAAPTGSITKTSTSQRENDVQPFTSTTTQPPRIRSQTVKVDIEPIIVKETQPQPITETPSDSKNSPKQNEALRRFLELNKQMLKALADKKSSTTELPDEPATTVSPKQNNAQPIFTTRLPPRLDKFRAITETTLTSNDNEKSSTTNLIPKNRATNPVASTRRDNTQPRTSTFLRPVTNPRPSVASDDDNSGPRSRPTFISSPPSTNSRSNPPGLRPESRTDNTGTRSRLPPPIRRQRPRFPGKRPTIGPLRHNVSHPLTARPTRFENQAEKQNKEVPSSAVPNRESVSQSVAEPEKRPVQPPRRFGSVTSAPRRNQFSTPRGRRKGIRKRVQNNRVSPTRRRKPTASPRFTTEIDEVTTHEPSTTAVPEFTTLPQEEDLTIPGFESTTQNFFDTTFRSDLERTTFPPEEETTLQDFSVTSRGRVKFENRHRPTQLPRITERPRHRSTLASKVAAFSTNEDATVQPVTRPLKPDTPEPPKPSSTFKPFEFETSATTISPTRFFTESASGISSFTGFDFDTDTTPPTTFTEDFEDSTQTSTDRFVNSQNFVPTTFSPFKDNQKQSVFTNLHQTTNKGHISRPSHISDINEAFFAEEDPPFVNKQETETFPPTVPITVPSNPFFGEVQETETFPPAFPTTTPDNFFHREIKEKETFPPAFPITTPDNPFFEEINDADAFPPALTITPPSNSFFVDDQDTATFSPNFATTVRPNFNFEKKQEAQTSRPSFQTTIPPNTVTPRIIVVALPILNQASNSPNNGNPLPAVSSPQSPVNERLASPINQESSTPFPDVIPPQTDKPLGRVQVTSEAGFIPREVHRPSTLTGGVKITAEEGFIPRDVVLQPPPSPLPQPDQTHPTLTLQNDSKSGTLRSSGNIEFVNDHGVSSQGSFSSSPSTTTQVPFRPVITVDSLLTFLGNDNSNSNKERSERPSLSLTPTTNPPSPIGTTSFTPNFKLQSTRFFNQRNDTPSNFPAEFSLPTTISPPLRPSPFLNGRPTIRDEFFNAPQSGFTPSTTLLPPKNPSTRQSILLRPLENLTPPSAPFIPSTPSPGSPPPRSDSKPNRNSNLRPFLPPSPTTSRPRTSTLATILGTLITKKPTTTAQPTTKPPTTTPQSFTTQDSIFAPSSDPPFSNQLGTEPPTLASIQPPFGNRDHITTANPSKPFDGDRNHLSSQGQVTPATTGDPNFPSRSNGQDSSRLPSPSSRPGPPSLESIPSQNAFNGQDDIRFSVRPPSDNDSPSEGSADAPPALTPSQFPSPVSNSLPPFPLSSKPNPNPLIKFPSRPSGDRPVLISSNRPSGVVSDKESSSSADPLLLLTTIKPRPESPPSHIQDGDSAFFFLSMDGHVTTHSTPAFVPNSQSSSSSTHNQPPFSSNNNQPHFDSSQAQLSNNKNESPFLNDNTQSLFPKDQPQVSNNRQPSFNNKQSPFNHDNRQSPFENDNRQSPPFDSDNRQSHIDNDRQSQFGNDNRQPQVGNDNRLPQFGNNNRQPQFGNNDRQPQFGNDNRQSQFGNNNRQPQFGNDNRRPQFGNEDRQPQFGNDNRRPQFGNDDRQPQFGNDNRRPQFGNEDRQPQFGNDNRRPQFGNEDRQPQFGNDNRRPQFGNEDRQPQFGNDNRRPQFGNEDRQPQFGNDNRRPQFGNDNRQSESSNDNRQQVGNDNRQPESSNNRQPQFGDDNRQPQFANDNRRPQFGNNDRQPQFGNDNRQPQFGNNREPHFGNNRQTQFGNDNRQPQFGNDNRQPQFDNDNRQPQLGNANRQSPFDNANRQPFNTDNQSLFNKDNRQSQFDNDNKQQSDNDDRQPFANDNTQQFNNNKHSTFDKDNRQPPFVNDDRKTSFNTDGQSQTQFSHDNSQPSFSNENTHSSSNINPSPFASNEEQSPPPNSNNQPTLTNNNNQQPTFDKQSPSTTGQISSDKPLTSTENQSSNTNQLLANKNNQSHDPNNFSVVDNQSSSSGELISTQDAIVSNEPFIQSKDDSTPANNIQPLIVTTPEPVIPQTNQPVTETSDDSSVNNSESLNQNNQPFIVTTTESPVSSSRQPFIISSTLPSPNQPFIITNTESSVPINDQFLISGNDSPAPHTNQPFIITSTESPVTNPPFIITNTESDRDDLFVNIVENSPFSFHNSDPIFKDKPFVETTFITEDGTFISSADNPFFPSNIDGFLFDTNTQLPFTSTGSNVFSAPGSQSFITNTDNQSPFSDTNSQSPSSTTQSPLAFADTSSQIPFTNINNQFPFPNNGQNSFSNPSNQETFFSNNKQSPNITPNGQVLLSFADNQAVFSPTPFFQSTTSPPATPVPTTTPFPHTSSPSSVPFFQSTTPSSASPAPTRTPFSHSTSSPSSVPFFQSTTSPASPVPTRTPFSHSTSSPSSVPFFQSTAAPASPVPTTPPFTQSTSSASSAPSITPFFQSTTPSPASPIPTTTPFSQPTSSVSSVPSITPFFQSTTPSPASPVPTTSPFSDSTTPSPASPAPTSSPFFHSISAGSPASPVSNTTPFFFSTTPSSASPVPTTTRFPSSSFPTTAFTTTANRSPFSNSNTTFTTNNQRPFFTNTNQSPAFDTNQASFHSANNPAPFANTNNQALFPNTNSQTFLTNTNNQASFPNTNSQTFLTNTNNQASFPTTSSQIPFRIPNSQPLFPISANSGSTLTSPSSQFSSSPFPTTQSSVPAITTPQPAITTHRPANRFPLPTAASPRPILPASHPAITTHRPGNRFPIPTTAPPRPLFQTSQPAITTHRPATNSPLPTTSSPRPPVRGSRPNRNRARLTTTSRPRSRATQPPRPDPPTQLSPNPPPAHASAGASPFQRPSSFLVPNTQAPLPQPLPISNVPFNSQFAPTANRGSAKFTSTTTPPPPPTNPPRPARPLVSEPSHLLPPSPTRGPSLLVPIGTEDQSASPGSAVENDPDGDHVPGLGGVDYPILESIPKTSFRCSKEMRLSGRMFADPETACQVYHVCSGHQTFSFLCPRGTIFHQDTFVCQWWFTVDCQAQAQKLAQIQAQNGR